MKPGLFLPGCLALVVLIGLASDGHWVLGLLVAAGAALAVGVPNAILRRRLAKAGRAPLVLRTPDPWRFLRRGDWWLVIGCPVVAVVLVTAALVFCRGVA